MLNYRILACFCLNIDSTVVLDPSNAIAYDNFITQLS